MITTQTAAAPNLDEPNVRQLLKERGLTIAALARLANCSWRQAAYYASGEKPMSQLELMGLQAIPKKSGRKKGKKHE